MKKNRTIVIKEEDQLNYLAASIEQEGYETKTILVPRYATFRKDAKNAISRLMSNYGYEVDTLVCVGDDKKEYLAYIIDRNLTKDKHYVYSIKFIDKEYKENTEAYLQELEKYLYTDKNIKFGVAPELEDEIIEAKFEHDDHCEDEDFDDEFDIFDDVDLFDGLDVKGKV